MSHINIRLTADPAWILSLRDRVRGQSAPYQLATRAGFLRTFAASHEPHPAPSGDWAVRSSISERLAWLPETEPAPQLELRNRSRHIQPRVGG
jgi:hypothetical protein